MYIIPTTNDVFLDVPQPAHTTADRKCRADKNFL